VHLILLELYKRTCVVERRIELQVEEEEGVERQSIEKWRLLVGIKLELVSRRKEYVLI